MREKKLKIKDSILTAVLLAEILTFSNNVYSQSYNAYNEIHDPFLPPEIFETKKTTAEELLKKLPFKSADIKGTVIDKDKRYVIIGTSIIKEKDMWQGLMIDKIEKNYLIVIYGNKKIKIPFSNKEM